MITVTLGLGESLRLGPDVKVTVLAVRGGEVRLGIQPPGPEDVTVGHETWQAILRACREKQEAERAKAAAQSLPAPLEAPPPAQDAPGQAGRPAPGRPPDHPSPFGYEPGEGG